MHFFIDHQILPLQTQANKYGSLTTDLYNLTSKFVLTSEAKALACRDGLLVVQQSKVDTSLVNVIIKPTKPIFSSGFRVAYFVYRGVTKSSIINGLNIVARNAVTNNELIKRIYKTDETKTFLAEVVGFDNNTLSDNVHIEKIFYNKGTLHAHTINEGEWFGNFHIGTIGFEVIFDHEKAPLTLGFFRSGSILVDISTETGDEAKRVKREYILSFIDPSAFFGLFYNEGVGVRSTTGTTSTVTVLKKVNLYNTLISKFYTKNTVYLDVRSERGYSYNFYNNYQLTGNIQTGAVSDVLTIQTYGDQSWPIFTYDTAQTTTLDNNKLVIKLKVEDNRNSAVYRLNIGGGKPVFSETHVDTGNWSKPLEFLFANVGSGSSRPAVSTYIKAYYFRRKSPLAVNARVPKSGKYFHSAFCSVDLPNIGDNTINLSKVQSSNYVLIDEPYVAANGLGGFTYSAVNKVIWDQNKVLFYSYALAGRLLRSEKAFHPIIPKKISCITTNEGDIRADLDIVCRLHQKLTSPGNFQNINIIGVNKYNNQYTRGRNNTANALDKDNALFLGLTLIELAAIKAVTGLNNNVQRHLYLDRTSTLRHRGETATNRFYEYAVKLQGIDSSGNANMVTPMITRNSGDTPTEILVYSRDNMFFSSIAFSASETVSPGEFRLEFNTRADGTFTINDNIDFSLITGDQPVHYSYEGTHLVKFDSVLSQKLGKGEILSESKKKTLPLPNPPWIETPNPGGQVEQTYKHNKDGTIFSKGHGYNPKTLQNDTNYQLNYAGLNKANALVKFDANTPVPGIGQVALYVTYNSLNLTFQYIGTQRRYARTDVAARFIGAFIRARFSLKSAGFSFADGSSFPSQTHHNGAALDTAYLSPLRNEQILIDALIYYGLTYIIKGMDHKFDFLTGTTKSETSHDTHLHSGFRQL